MAGLLPMIAALERAFGINQNVGDILRVAHLAVAFADLEQRIVGGARRIGRIEQEHRSKPGAPAGGQLEILALDVVDDRGIRPRQQGWDDKTDTLARPGRRKTQHMLGTVVPQIAVAQTAKHDAVGSQKSGTPHLPCIGPTRRAVRRDVLSFFRAPDREDDGDADGCDPAARGDAPALDEDLRRVGIELEPPDEEGERLIDRPAPDHEPGGSELRLESKTPGRPLGRRPEEGEHDHRDEEQLTPEDFGCGHAQR